MALARVALSLAFWMTHMAHYQLTSAVTLTLKPCPPALHWFAAKTNRLALYSVRLGGWEFDLYVARKWQYPAGDDGVEYLDESEFAAAVEQQAKAPQSLTN